MFRGINKSPIESAISDFFEKKSKGDSLRDKTYLNKLLFENKLNLKNFEEQNFDIYSFDWKDGSKNRNWWWQLQALPFLYWLVNSRNKISETESERLSNTCLGLLRNWVKNSEDKNSPLKWHDHAVCLRLNNLVNFYIYLKIYQYGLFINNNKEMAELRSVIYEHADWLVKESNYTRYTNHGFDQSLYLLISCCTLDFKKNKKFKAIARSRLKDEIYFAFTEEGVHKENSPGYQRFMLGRLKALEDLKLIGENELGEIGNKLVKKVERFLAAITLPNGELPTIGDTLGGEVGISENTSSEEKLFDYSKSGYVILRGKACNDEYCLIFKNTHNSNYHRHDDDLSVFLYFKDRVIIGDGGLFSHNEKDNKRKFLRSPYAHSIPVANTIAERDKSNLIESPSIDVDLDNKCITGNSYMFGNLLTRKVYYEKIQEGKVRIVDSSKNMGINQNFLIPYEPDSTILKKDCVIINKSNISTSFKVLDHKHSLNIIQGWNRGKNFDSAIYSEKFGQCLPGLRVMSSGLRVETEVSFKDTSDDQ